MAQPVALNSAAKLSLSKAVPASTRTSTVAGRNKALAGSGLITILAAAAVVVSIVIVIVIVADGDSDSN